MTYRIGDLVRFSPAQIIHETQDSSIGMVGMVVGDAALKWDADEYLSVLWADGETLDTHLSDLEPVV